MLPVWDTGEHCWHIGGPWEQQEGHVGARNQIFIDFGAILGPVDKLFWALRLAIALPFSGLLPGYFLYDFLNRNLDTWDCFRMETIAKTIQPQKCCLLDSGLISCFSDFCCA